MWYLLNRGIQMLVILVILSVALFGLLSLMPGNPVDLLITSNPNVKPEDVVRLKRLRALDRPWYVQYVRWVLGYPEPARPPIIHEIRPLVWSGAKSHDAVIDLSESLVDPNFVPSREKIESWLGQVWPDWDKSEDVSDIKEALLLIDMPEILRLVAKHDRNKQSLLVDKIYRASAETLTLTGLFGSKAAGLKLIPNNASSIEQGYLWFKVTNSYGQEKVGRVLIKNLNRKVADVINKIDSRIVEDEKKPFTVDLKKFLVDESLANEVEFALVEGSPGAMSGDGVYTNLFRESGQTAVLSQVKVKGGPKQLFAFDVESGVVGHKTKFNNGFIYFLTGDRNALGFSYTYKRPVYDLLFGAPPVCGDFRIDAGETCDDGNKIAGDGCDPNCFLTSDGILAKADASISGYIVRSGRIGNTIQLMLPALLLSLLIAIPLGVFSAYRQYTTLDYIINFLAFIGISLPVFWFGIMMIYVFAENFQLFPAGGVQTPGIYGEGTWSVLLDRLKYAVLPTMVLSIFYIGRWLRYMRASMLEVMPKDYIRTARAKGLSERVVILKHAFRNALIPVVTVLALSIPSLFGGAVLTETVFSWPGVGRLQYEAVMNSDYYVAIIVFLVSAILVMVGNLLADAVYVLVDPRIRKK